MYDEIEFFKLRLNGKFTLLFFFLYLFWGSIGVCNGLEQVENPNKVKTFYDRNLPVFAQSTDYTCGPTVALSILTKRRIILNKQYTDQSLGAFIGTTSEVGTPPEMLAEGLKQFGLKAKVVSYKDMDDFLRDISSNKDYILLINDDGAHWVGLSAIENDTLVLMDPWENKGQLRKISKADIESSWMNVRLDTTTTVYNFLAVVVE